MFDKMFRSPDKTRRANPYKREELLKWKELLFKYKTRLPNNEESGRKKLPRDYALNGYKAAKH